MRKVFTYIKETSERLPNKNFRNLGGKALWKWVIEALDEFDVYVNTDSTDLYEELKKYSNVTPIRRSSKHIEWEENAKEFGSPVMDMVKEFIESHARSNEDFAVVHVTSPFLKAETLNLAFELFERKNCHSVHSVKKIQDFIMGTKHGVISPSNFTFSHISRTQDLDPIYQSIGAFFILNTVSLKRRNFQRLTSDSILYPIPSIEAIEIDDEEDFALAEVVARSLEGVFQ